MRFKVRAPGSGRNPKGDDRPEVSGIIRAAAESSMRAQGAPPEQIAELLADLDAEAEHTRQVLARERQAAAEAASHAKRGRGHVGAAALALSPAERARRAEERDGDREALSVDLSWAPPPAPSADETELKLAQLPAIAARKPLQNGGVLQTSSFATPQKNGENGSVLRSSSCAPPENARNLGGGSTPAPASMGKSDGARRAARRRAAAPTLGTWQPAEGEDRVPFPRAARRRAAAIARSPHRELPRFLASLPASWRAAIRLASLIIVPTKARPGARRRHKTARTAHRVQTLAAVLLASSYESERHGFARVVHGLPREALVLALPANAETGRPIHVNTLSTWVRALELGGFLETLQPNGAESGAVEVGRTGWALNQYRIRPPAEGAGAGVQPPRGALGRPSSPLGALGAPVAPGAELGASRSPERAERAEGPEGPPH